MVPEILLHVASHAVQIHNRNADLEHRRIEFQALEKQLEQQYSRDELQASMAKELLRSLVDGRIAVVQAGFIQALTVIKDQAEHYMRQQDKVQDAKDAATDLLVISNLDARLCQIDVELRDIRGQAVALYLELNRTVLLIGGTMPPLGHDFKRVLMLS
jgi:hypothetical protein